MDCTIDEIRRHIVRLEDAKRAAEERESKGLPEICFKLYAEQPQWSGSVHYKRKKDRPNQGRPVT